MPVTVRPASHPASLVSYDTSRPADNARDVLRYACPEDQRKCLELPQSSFDSNLSPAMLPAENGLVNAAIRAYSDHHHLIIRPEDIWVAILTQFSFYVNAHAEELRNKFVKHKARRELKIVYESGDRYSFDFSVFARDLSHLIQKHVTNQELREWIMPDFSTTTKHDMIIASIIMMGSMQKYFTYKCSLRCGLPSVTLLGEKTDYQRINHKLEKLCSFGKETTDFCRLIQPIVRRFCQSFDEPSGEETLDFWNRIFTRESDGSGPDCMSGWITAFCFWNSKGERQCHRQELSNGEKKDKGIYVISEFKETAGGKYSAKLVIDGQIYPRMELDNGVPAGFCKVPVKVDDNGNEFDAEMIAGSVGISCTSSGEETEGEEVVLDTMQPQTGWWIYEKISMRGA